MKIPGLRAADEKIHGIAHFGRMLDKIRLHGQGNLPGGYFLGEEDFSWWDARCCRFLGIPYDALREKVEAGATDEEVLQWCFEKAGRPSDEQIEIWSTFLLKRGWRDGSTPFLEQEKQASGFGDREDIVTWSDLQKAEEA